jgi:hypothetical protein
LGKKPQFCFGKTDTTPPSPKNKFGFNLYVISDSYTFFIKRVSAAQSAAETRTIGRGTQRPCRWCKM